MSHTAGESLRRASAASRAPGRRRPPVPRVATSATESSSVAATRGSRSGVAPSARATSESRAEACAPSGRRERSRRTVARAAKASSPRTTVIVAAQRVGRRWPRPRPGRRSPRSAARRTPRQRGPAGARQRPPPPRPLPGSPSPPAASRAPAEGAGGPARRAPSRGLPRARRTPVGGRRVAWGATAIRVASGSGGSAPTGRSGGRRRGTAPRAGPRRLRPEPVQPRARAQPRSAGAGPRPRRGPAARGWTRDTARGPPPVWEWRFWRPVRARFLA